MLRRQPRHEPAQRAPGRPALGDGQRRRQHEGRLVEGPGIERHAALDQHDVRPGRPASPTATIGSRPSTLRSAAMNSLVSSAASATTAVSRRPATSELTRQASTSKHRLDGRSPAASHEKAARSPRARAGHANPWGRGHDGGRGGASGLPEASRTESARIAGAGRRSDGRSSPTNLSSRSTEIVGHRRRRRAKPACYHPAHAKTVAARTAGRGRRDGVGPDPPADRLGGCRSRNPQAFPGHRPDRHDRPADHAAGRGEAGGRLPAARCSRRRASRRETFAVDPNRPEPGGPAQGQRARSGRSC